MYSNNPYAQGGWYNPENPLSLNNGVWGSQSPPQPSVFGALPSTGPAPPAQLLTFTFVAFHPTILNCTVVGPQSQKYLDITTASPGVGAATVFRRQDGPMAVVEWHQSPTVEVQGVIPKQLTARWMGLSQDKRWADLSRLIGFHFSYY